MLVLQISFSYKSIHLTSMISICHLSGIHKYVILRKLCNIFLKLSQFFLTVLFLILNAHSVKLALVSQSLVFSMNDFPFLFQGCNKLVSLLLIK